MELRLIRQRSLYAFTVLSINTTCMYSAHNSCMFYTFAHHGRIRRGTNSVSAAQYLPEPLFFQNLSGGPCLNTPLNLCFSCTFDSVCTHLFLNVASKNHLYPFNMKTKAPCNDTKFCVPLWCVSDPLGPHKRNIGHCCFHM